MNLRKLESEQMNVNEAVSDFKWNAGTNNAEARKNLEDIRIHCTSLISAAEAAYNLSLYQNVLEKR